MRYNIILSDLDKCLFPEVYPYFNQYFQNELDYLRKHYAYDETSMLNIAFKVKVVKYCSTVKDANLRYVINSFFNKHIENYFDWHRKYDWHELKSILMFFWYSQQYATKMSWWV